jgi:hypothetical protein
MKVFGLVETWVPDHKELTLGNYRLFSAPAKRIKKSGRVMGGILVGVRKGLANYIKKLESPSGLDTVVWILLQGRKDSVIIAICYRPPRGSPMEDHNFFGKLGDDLLSFLGEYRNAKWMLMGDYNVRVGTLTEEWWVHAKDATEYGGRESADEVISAEVRELQAFLGISRGLLVNGRFG